MSFYNLVHLLGAPATTAPVVEHETHPLLSDQLVYNDIVCISVLSYNTIYEISIM